MIYTAIFNSSLECDEFIAHEEKMNGARFEWYTRINTGAGIKLTYTILPTPYNEFKKFMDFMNEIDPFFNPYE